VICKASDVKEWNETSLATYDQLHQPSFEELCARLGHRNFFDTEGLSSNLNTPLPHVMSLSTALSYCWPDRETQRGRSVLLRGGGGGWGRSCSLAKKQATREKRPQQQQQQVKSLWRDKRHRNKGTVRR